MRTNDLLIVVVAFGGFGVVVFTLGLLFRRRELQLLKAWAAKRSLSIVHVERYRLSILVSDWTTTYYLTLRDGNALEKQAYLRVRHWPMSLIADEVEVEWD